MQLIMKSSCPFRRRLILTTILTAMPMISYGRLADAACVASPAPPSFLCSGSNATTQVIDANNANVTTASGFSVDAATGHGIMITGDGGLKFTDDYRSAINGDESGLFVYAKADSGTIPGSVTITTSGTIAG